LYAEARLDDLRLAHLVLTTRWHRLGRRLPATDVHGSLTPVGHGVGLVSYSRVQALGRPARARTGPLDEQGV